MSTSLDLKLHAWQSAVDEALAHAMQSVDAHDTRLPEAMGYSLLGPAKRVRALFTLLVADTLGVASERAMVLAVAIEMVHASSLVFDDLPSMDDAKLRRGRDTNHRVYGEATAVLAGVGLMNEAFAHIAKAPGLTAPERNSLTEQLAHAIGTDGLVAGQEQDLHPRETTSQQDALTHIETVHRRKTGILFALAAGGTASLADLQKVEHEAFVTFGMNLGLAFQTYDDLLDERADTALLGKDTGQDTTQPTFIKLLGVEATQQRARAYLEAAFAQVPAHMPRDGLVGQFVDRLIETMLSGRQSLTTGAAAPSADHGHG